MSNTNLGDDLLKEAQRLQEAIGQSSYDRQKKKDQSKIGRIRGDIAELSGFFNQLAQAGSWIYNNVIKPVAERVPGPVMSVARAYKHHIWDRLVYAHDQYDTPYFSKKRAAGVLTATFLALACVPTAARVALDTGLYTATAHVDEKIYLTDPDEIFPALNIHSVRGCHELPCDESNSIYFRVEPRLFNEIWSLTNRGGLFYPDYVASAVPPGMNQCVATSYGIRSKPYVTYTDKYPDLLAAKCQPVNVNQNGEAQPSWTVPAP